MPGIIPPSIAELWEAFEWHHVDPDSPFLLVHEAIKDSWNLGLIEEVVLQRKVDKTFWSVVYTTSRDGQINEFRDGLVDPVQVTPITHTITTWQPVIE
jgi:hypothetical protein